MTQREPHCNITRTQRSLAPILDSSGDIVEFTSDFYMTQEVSLGVPVVLEVFNAQILVWMSSLRWV